MRLTPGLEGGVDDRGGVLLRGAADGAEVHRAQRERAHLDTGPAQGAVLHVVSLDLSSWKRNVAPVTIRSIVPIQQTATDRRE